MYLTSTFRKLGFSFFCIALFSGFSGFAQFPTGITGLALRLDAAVGYNDNGSLPSTWTDLSSSNDMISGVGTAEPVRVPNVASTGFPGIVFDGTDDYMISKTLGTSFEDTAATIFVVKIASFNPRATSSTDYKALVSLAEDSTFLNEIGIGSDWALLHSSDNNYAYRTHKCYDSIPTNLPVILYASVGGAPSNFNVRYMVYGNEDFANPIQVAGVPTATTKVKRRIVLGGRFHSDTKTNVVSDLFSGSILEVIAYKRKLSFTEIKSVHDYLINKYFSASGATATLETDTICEGEQAFLTYTVPNVATGVPVTVTYTDGTTVWQKGVQNGVPFPVAPNPSTTTTYSTIVGNVLDVCGLTIGGGASSIATVVVAAAANAEAGKDQLVCPGELVQLSGTGNGDFSWYPTDSMDDPNSQTPKVRVFKPTIYRLIVANASGCVDTDQVSVAFKTSSFEVNPEKKTICFGDTVQLFAKGGHTYEWSPGATLSDSTIFNPIAIPTGDITYFVSVYAPECEYKATLPIEIKVNPKPSAVATATNNIECNMEAANLMAVGGTSYYWYPVGDLNDPNIPNPVATPSKKTKYTVSVTNQFGCEDTATVEVDVKNKSMIALPNAFSPNGDGMNDCYEVKVLFPVRFYEFGIYNRWGNCVFKTNNPIDCWNGEYKGKMQDAGTYTYYYKIITDVCGELSREGSIHLIR